MTTEQAEALNAAGRVIHALLDRGGFFIDAIKDADMDALQRDVARAILAAPLP